MTSIIFIRNVLPLASDRQSGQHSLMHDEWYRAWRHDERDYDCLRAVDARFRRRETIKRVAGEIMIVGAVVAFAWSMMPV